MITDQRPHLAITAYLQSRRNAALSPTATEQESSRLNEDPVSHLTEGQRQTQSTNPKAKP